MDEQQAANPISQKPLKAKHALFVQAYLITKNASESARRAGFSAHTAGITGYKLLKNPRIKAEIDRIQAEELAAVTAKAQEVSKARSKDALIDGALKDYESLPIESPVRPRYLDLAMKGLGIIGGAGDSRPNQTLIVNVDAKTLDSSGKWDKLRQLIDGA